jgi:hypothetical protein
MKIKYFSHDTFENGTKEEFGDTKGVMRIRILKKNRQHNGQKKTYKRTNNDLQSIHIKLKIKKHEPHYKPGVNSFSFPFRW